MLKVWLAVNSLVRHNSFDIRTIALDACIIVLTESYLSLHLYTLLLYLKRFFYFIKVLSYGHTQMVKTVLILSQHYINCSTITHLNQKQSIMETL